MLWEESAKWVYLDHMNQQLSSRHSLLAHAAANNWPGVKYLSITCLLLSFMLLVFYCVVACMGEVSWKVQIAAAVTQLLLSFILCLSLGLGLQTDTVKPQMFGNYFYGCNVHAEPGAAWWFGVLALVISVFAGVLLMFPYLAGPTWVLKWAKSIEVMPSEDEYDRYHEELELADADDPFADIHLSEDHDDDDVDDVDGEWEDEDDEGWEDNSVQYEGGEGDDIEAGKMRRKKK